MKSYIYILSLFIGLFFFVSCEKDLFEGKDNYIIEFTIQSGERSYNAGIEDNRILLEIPAKVNLSNVSVKYTLSELASISPDPANIKDWSKGKQTLVVKSHNGQERKYTVEIKQIYEAAKENITLLTDTDVQKFAARGISNIEGSLTIGASEGKDSISNIDALQRLKSVTYDIIINSTYKGKNLKGLSNIRYAGSIILGANYKNLKAVQFPSLENLFGTLKITTDSIKELSFPKLKEIESIIIGGDSYFEFQNIKEIKFPEMEKIGRDASFRGGNIETIAFPKLKEAGRITIQSGNIATFKADMLEKVRAFKFDRIYSNNKKMKELSLPKLSYCEELFEIRNLANLKRINLPELVTVDSFIQRSESVNDLNIDKLEIVKTKLRISSALKSITLNRLKECESISFMFNDNCVDISVPELTKCAGLSTENNKILKSISAKKLEKIEVLRLFEPAITTLNFPILKEISIRLAIGSNLAEEIFNTTLTNLNGLKSLRSVGDYNISYCSKLTDYSALKPMVESGDLTKKKWNNDDNMKLNGYNPTFEDLKAGRYVKP